MKVLSLLLFTLASAAEAPVVGRPREHFYGAVGEQVRVELSISPAEVKVEDPLVLIISIRDAANPDQIERPDLRQLSEFAERFFIDDLPDDRPPAGQRDFHYRLRPKIERVHDVPPLLFHYWNPRVKYFATTAPREAIALKVLPRMALPKVEQPLNEPDFLFEQPSREELREGPWSDVTRMAVFFLVIWIPALVFEAWYIFWKRLRPRSARMAEMRRSRAVRLALDRLESVSANDVPDFGDRVVMIIRNYLRERFGLPENAATPTEVAAELRRLNVRPALVEEAERFIHSCDAARYGASQTSRMYLPVAAKSLIMSAEQPS